MNEITRTRVHRAIIVVLLLVIAALVYKFLVAGSTERAEDGRLAVVLAPAERALMLREMRGFVAGLQAISAGLAREDMKAVANAAREMGSSRAHDVPAAMMGKLPLEFKTLALGVHRGFDAIASDAESGAKPAQTLGELADVLQSCVACHASYQVKEAAARS